MTEINEKEIEKTELLKISEISLWLDTYDDIFSDFDSRPYFERALSDDFLTEVKKASRDKRSGEIELRFLIHKQNRNINHENLVRRRLKEHFKKHHDRLRKDIKKIKNKGYIMVFVGIILLAISAYLTSLGFINFLVKFVETLFIASGWFLSWDGLELLMFGAKDIKTDIDFYEKMSKAQIIFTSY